jgi:tetratricopeptide (TPR) repeat protein
MRFKTFFFLFFIFISISGKSQVATHNYLKASYLVIQQQYDSALKYFDAAIAADASNVLFYCEKAKVFQLKGDFEMSFELFQKANKMKNGSGLLGMAQCAAMLGNDSLCLAILGQYLSLPNCGGEDLVKRDVYLKHIENSRRWQTFWQKDWYSENDAIARNCMFMARSGQAMEAAEIINPLIKKNKRSAILYYARASVNLNFQQNAAAFEDMIKAVRLAPTRWEWNNKLAEIAILNKEWDVALKAINKSLNNNPAQFDLYQRRAEVLMAQKDFLAAMNDVDLLLIYFSDNADYYVLKAQIFEMMQMPLQALMAYNKALSLNPNSSVILYKRAKNYLATGMKKEALADFIRICELEPDNGENWYLTANLLFDNGEKDRACDCYQHAAKRGYLKAFSDLDKKCSQLP